MTSVTQRRFWISTLAKASLVHLEQQLGLLGDLPRYEFLRAPEIGLAMVQGRSGGTGQPFYLGEMTLTRCVVRLVADVTQGRGLEGTEAIAGCGYITGRSHRHAELAAVCDALLQHPGWHDRVLATVIKPLGAAQQQQQQQQERQVESTRVNFFTMVRGS